MATVHWHIQLTLESSTKKLFLDICQAERRAAANMLRILIEREIQERKNDQG